MGWLGRLLCGHQVYLIDPDNPSVARCIYCDKRKRL